jgi:hypothetical protein
LEEVASLMKSKVISHSQLHSESFTEGGAKACVKDPKPKDSKGKAVQCKNKNPLKKEDSTAAIDHKRLKD